MKGLALLLVMLTVIAGCKQQQPVEQMLGHDISVIIIMIWCFGVGYCLALIRKNKKEG